MATSVTWLPRGCERCKGTIYTEDDAEKLREVFGQQLYAHRDRDHCIEELAQALERLSDAFYGREN